LQKTISNGCLLSEERVNCVVCLAETSLATEEGRVRPDEAVVEGECSGQCASCQQGCEYVRRRPNIARKLALSCEQKSGANSESGGVATALYYLSIETDEGLIGDLATISSRVDAKRRQEDHYRGGYWWSLSHGGRVGNVSG